MSASTTTPRGFQAVTIMCASALLVPLVRKPPSASNNVARVSSLIKLPRRQQSTVGSLLLVPFAAAYKLSLEDWPGQNVALLTKNLKDFPSQAFAGTQVIRHSLSGYIDALYAAEPAHVAKVAEACRKKLE